MEVRDGLHLVQRKTLEKKSIEMKKDQEEDIQRYGRDLWDFNTTEMQISASLASTGSPSITRNTGRMWLIRAPKVTTLISICMNFAQVNMRLLLPDVASSVGTVK